MKINTAEQAVKTAKLIKEDRNGADYYQDPEILAGFLEGQFGATDEKAKKVAEAISEDRRGADYYEDEKVLAQFLEGQFE